MARAERSDDQEGLAEAGQREHLPRQDGSPRRPGPGPGWEALRPGRPAERRAHANCWARELQLRAARWRLRPEGEAGCGRVSQRSRK